MEREYITRPSTTARGHLRLQSACLPEKVQGHGARVQLGLQQLAQAQQGVPAHAQHQRARAWLQRAVAAAHQDDRTLQVPPLPAGLRDDLQLHPAPQKPGPGRSALRTSPFGRATVAPLPAKMWKQLGVPIFRHACHAITLFRTRPLPFSHFQPRVKTLGALLVVVINVEWVCLIACKLNE